MLNTAALYYFSPTGGTKEVAESFCAEISENVKCIDIAKECLDKSADAAELVVVAAPVFGGRIPVIVTERLRTLSGSGKKAVTLAVYGNRAYEDALLELNNVMEECDFAVVASAALVTRHSIVPEVAAGRPDATDKAEIRDFAEKVLAKIKQAVSPEEEVLAEGSDKENGCNVKVPGNYPYKDNMKVSATPISKEGCSGCGACASICPTGAIQMVKDADIFAESEKTAPAIIKTDLEKCILCMACVANCPKQARALPAPMQDAMNQKLGALKDVRGKNDFFV